jgi:hypothetical protein
MPRLAGILALTSLQAAPAAAQSNEASCDAVKKTESMRAAGQYRASRVLLLECVRRRCATVLQKLDAVTPSIVVRAQLANGDDATDVSVSLEGQVLATALDGVAIPIDPGEHNLVLQRTGQAPVAQTVTIREGEKFRAIDVQLEPASMLGAGDGAAQAKGRGFPDRWAIGGTLIGVGVVGLTTFTWLGLTARSDESVLKDCKPFCSKAKGDSVRTRYWLANISGGIGVLALGGATWLLLSAPRKPSATVSDLAGLSIVAGSDGAFASYSHDF